MNLNQRAAVLCRTLQADADLLRIGVQQNEIGTHLIDCGIGSPGGLECGRRLAEVCTAGLARVQFVPADKDVHQGAAVLVVTDHPVAACMAAQYAGWEVKADGYFAMGSGPMRAAYGGEALLGRIGFAERATQAVGVLETAQLPPLDVCRQLAEKCRVEPDQLILLAAPTSSQAGTVQIVARSVETALHKLGELGFDLLRIESAWGVAPLPPVAANDLEGIGRTNDAILYGGEVTLYVRGDDEDLQAIGPKLPSCASHDHGAPFQSIFERYNRDFYQIDPHLFSPAVVTFSNLDSGRTHRFGHTVPRVIHESFG